MLRSSPVTLPWNTLRLAGRFAVPLALWFTIGQVLRYLLFLGGYHFGLHHAPVPIFVISLIVMVSLGVTVAMLHSVKDGLPAVRKRELDESLTSWTAAEEETILDAVTRALLPFMIFYLAWNWFTDDAQAFEQSAAGRGNAQGGLSGQIQAMKLTIAIEDHIWVAIALTAAFLVLKFIAERFVEPRWPRVGGITVALFEVNWTLFGLFTINKARGDLTDWITNRVFWHWLGEITGPAFGWFDVLWPSFKEAVLGGLVWLVIAGVILGVDADEETQLGRGRVGRGLASASGMDRPHTPWEVITREWRDKWLPTVYGFRMVFRSGLLPFMVFCVLFTGLDDGALLLKRGVYHLLGPHPIVFWMPALQVISFFAELLHQILRVCLMAAAFDMVVARVSERSAKPASAPTASASAARRAEPRVQPS
ncbi:hypothetical protein [Actinoallomurus iriomotensis]|uniref:Uncharacterized protein n=1 Tax=Actinoallomurus iriomotensis TaxID=478107 RepID=A0A9W6RFR6_9ACTN|nr:hypothetical protein [Actinoallomurus iriomotensis]GLY74759.1 hypothetical protein Airi01_030260 [Actinoallomurus iriomotensis]